MTQLFVALCVAAIVLLNEKLSVTAIECYQCQNVNIGDKSGLMSKVSSALGLPKSDNNEHCETVDGFYESPPVVTCPVDYVCGFVKTTLKANVILETISAVTVARGCIPADGFGSYCDAGVDVGSKILGKLLSYSSDGLFGAGAKACVCDNNKCVAGGCPSGFYGPIFNKCWNQYLFWGAGGALVLLSISLICCCCCCRKRKQGHIILPAGAVQFQRL